ncbi:hypothetical protein ASPWEDRAFT_166907 [Aspergillus wentii DTO 134E9]|uniref:Cytochrome P450 n=1 Tax=Aspergillus wentii DTO 134E9 TaxID=1073089 RepID=A0A1L9S109_ASPWE|nr:uncharacterized protein ASPWEDRAFT_166907 [Aspergillus wentii DTO 134E9]KAI9931146.1 hypothetical protein MW887_010803 [Aspergillus wentii]OJJ40851.1 hypothetical protein ASPWEDRAFT_166907 [Aspergillus wentii DTO 134E9]
MFDLLHAFPWIGLLVLLYATWRVIFNRHLHPFSSYPEPFFASATRIPYSVAFIQGNLHIFTSPDELSYSNEEAWKEVHGHSSNLSKDMQFYNTPNKKAPKCGDRSGWDSRPPEIGRERP